MQTPSSSSPSASTGTRAFTPVANASSITLLGEPARSQIGETVDYGVRASLHGGRLSISLNHFANSVTNQGRGGGAYTGPGGGAYTGPGGGAYTGPGGGAYTGPGGGLYTARAAAPTQDQVAARTLGRAVVLRLLRVAGATAGLVVAGRINGIGLILIVSQTYAWPCATLAAKL